MELRKKKGFSRLVNLAGIFALMLIFAGFAGKADVQAAENVITVKVNILDNSTQKPISNDLIHLEVGTWDSVKYTPAIRCESDNGEIQYQISDGGYSLFLPVCFQVQAKGYKTKSIANASEASKNSKLISGNINKCCWWFDDLAAMEDPENNIIPEVTIYMEPYTDGEVMFDYQEKAVDEISNYVKLEDYLEESMEDDQKSDRERVTETIKEYSKQVYFLNTDCEIDDFKEAADEIVANAKTALEQIPTKQSRMNEKYMDRIKFIKRTKVVGLSRRTTGANDEYQYNCTIHLRRFDQNGKFEIEGIGDQDISEWNAWLTVKAPEASIGYTKTYYINPYGKDYGTLGMFMTDPQNLYPSETLINCYVTFYDPETNSDVKVTFDLQVTTCTINSVTAELSENITDNDNKIQLQRDNNLDYTTCIVKDGEEGSAYTYSVSVDSSEPDYKGGYVLTSSNPSIATMKDGVIIPHSDGECTFRATSEDDDGKYDDFTITFTLDEAEEEEKAAAQEVINLIAAIADKGEITTDNTDALLAITAARDAYNNLEYHEFTAKDATGKGAQKKVSNYAELEDAENTRDAYPVVVKIDAIGSQITTKSEGAIKDARSAYEALTDAQKVKVTNYDDLVDAENTLAALKVDEKIAAIGSPITTESEGAIKDARAAYNVLTDAQKAKVTKQDVLADAENTLAALKVDALIGAIGSVITLDSEGDIVAARQAYTDYTGIYSTDKVTKQKELKDAEDTLAALKVDTMIAALFPITTDSVDDVGKAKRAYDALTDEGQKPKVKYLDQLEDAENTLSALLFEDRVDQVNEVEITTENVDDVETTIVKLKEEYESLDEKVTVKLSEELMRKIAAVETEISDVRTAADVEEQLKALNNLTISLSSESQVKAVRAAYNALTDNAKSKISSYAVLEAAESRISVLKEAERQAQEAANAQASANTQTTQAPTTPAVTLNKITLKVKVAKGKVKLTWKKSSKAQGYIIYRATKKNGTYKKIKVITKWKTTSYTDKKVKSKKQYFYKICPYKGTVTGPLSSAKKVKVK